MRNFTLWDDQDPNHKVLVGEYGVARDNGNEELWKNHREWPWWIASVAEGIFHLGVERNPDRVYGVAFAPLLQNIDSFQWNVRFMGCTSLKIGRKRANMDLFQPNLITFNANTSATVRSTSFHVMELFSNHRFTEVLPVENSAEYSPAFWMAGINEGKHSYTWKGAVYNTTETQDFNIHFPEASSNDTAKLTVLTAPDAFSENLFGEADIVNREEVTLQAGREGGFKFSLPQWSVAVLDWTYE